MIALLCLGVLQAAPNLDAPLGPGVSLKMRDPTAAAITTEAVSPLAFWQSATLNDYDGQRYDQIRLRPLDSGLVRAP